MLVYINNCVLMSPSDRVIDKAFTLLKALKQNFMIKDEGSIGDFLGVKINHDNDRMTMLL